MEATLAFNFVAPAALTGRLAALLAAAPAARCVNVVSSAFAMLRGDPFADPPSRYVGIDAYAQAKLLTVLWTCQLAADATRAPKPALAGVFCANPGMAWTPNVQQLTRQAVPAWRLVWPLVRWLQRRAAPVRAARPPLYAATAPLEALTSGLYRTLELEVSGARGWSGKARDPVPCEAAEWVRHLEVHEDNRRLS